MDTLKALSIINNIERIWYKPPAVYGSRNFMYQSYKHAAITEIKIYLFEHCFNDAITSINDFACMVDDFACEAKNPTTNFMFSVYYDVTMDILDSLLTANRTERNDQNG